MHPPSADVLTVAAMVQVGRYNTLEVRKQTRSGFQLGSGPDAVFLPGPQAPEGLQPGTRLRVFVYTDSEGILVGSTHTPKASVGEFAFLQCVQVNQHGAFLDWGMPKDLFVPFAEQYARMEPGQGYVVAVCLDERVTRAMASSKLAPFFDYDLRELSVGDPQPLLVFGHTPIGTQVVVDQRYVGLIYADSMFEHLPVGSELTGYVAALRDDNRVDISLTRPDATGTGGGRDRAQQLILDAMGSSGGFLPLHDRSPPADIQRRLGLSKQAFKRAVGGLYKARRIRLEDAGIRLAEAPTGDPSD